MRSNPLHVERETRLCGTGRLLHISEAPFLFTLFGLRDPGGIPLLHSRIFLPRNSFAAKSIPDHQQRQNKTASGISFSIRDSLSASTLGLFA
ncbi:hypothetical protein CDAR_213211 [Caerostris darwini]|uniref:Ycf15 n=1 Tax=Caerostris darwini TaxID=1538125 RepID=A0AAV4PZ97_9ARAC|nr:hypothetical protein CDAR_213211 [Caerostris darwini]